MKSCIIFALYQILIRWSNQGEWDGQGGGTIMCEVDQERYRILVGRSGGSNPLSRFKHRRKNSIKMDLGGTVHASVDRIHMAQEKAQWLASAHTVLKLLVTWKARNVTLTGRLRPSKEELCSMDLIIPFVYYERVWYNDTYFIRGGSR
jgi:hypothetical protein